MAYAADWTKDLGNYNVGHKDMDGMVTLVRYLDFSDTKYNLASGSYYKIFAVPDNFALVDAYVSCDVVEGAAETIDIVDDDSATTTFVNDATLNTAGYLTATNARKTYQAAGYICILANADITVAKAWVIVKGIILDTNM